MPATRPQINPQNQQAKKLVANLQTNDWVNATPSIPAPAVSTVTSSPTPIPVTIVSQKPWYREPWFLVVSFLFCFPLFRDLYITTDKTMSMTVKLIVILALVLACIGYLSMTGYLK